LGKLYDALSQDEKYQIKTAKEDWVGQFSDVKKKESSESNAASGSSNLGGVDDPLLQGQENPEIIPQPQAGSSPKENLLAPEPPKPYTPEQLNLQAQKAVLGKDIPTNMVDIAKITTDKTSLHNEAYAMAQQGKTAAVNAIADINIQEHPDDPYPYQLKAHNLELNKDYKGAVIQMNNAIANSPNNADLYYQRAILSQKAGLGEDAKKDAAIYVASANKSGKFDEQTAFNKAQSYALMGDEKNAEYQNYIYEGFKSDKQKGIDSDNLIALSNWMGEKVTLLGAPISMPAMGIIEGAKKIGEGVETGSVSKVASGVISAGFGALMATPAGAVFNSAIAAGQLVGAGEVTDWFMAPFSKLNELAGVDESKFTDTGKLINEIANFIPLMLFMGGYHKTAGKFAKRLPFDEGDIRNLDGAIATATPETVKAVAENMDKFKKDRESAAEVSAIQKSNPETATYRIDDKLLPKKEFVAEVKARKEKGVIKPDVEVVGDPVTEAKVAEIIEPTVEIKAEPLKTEPEIKAEPLKEEPVQAEVVPEKVQETPVESPKVGDNVYIKGRGEFNPETQYEIKGVSDTHVSVNNGQYTRAIPIENISKELPPPESSKPTELPTETPKPNEEAKGEAPEETVQVNPLSESTQKYGWKSEPTKTGYDLYNGKGKKVVTVEVKGNKYVFKDQAGNKLMSGNKDVSTATEKLIKDYYYGKEKRINRLFTASLTHTRPWPSTAIPDGKPKSPCSEPFSPQACTNAPLEVNSSTRNESGSVAKMCPCWSTAR